MKYEYAVKVISKSDPENYDRDSMLKELRILSVINHPNIPKIYGVYETVDQMYIFMENIHGGCLFDRLRESKNPITGIRFSILEEEASLVTSQLLETLVYLQELKIMHRDIKSENVLVRRNEESGEVQQAFLIDFGLATFCDYSEEKQMCGTIGYVAPEVLLGKGYGRAVDVFSLGVLMFFMMTGELPFEDKSDGQIIEFTIHNSLPLKSSLFGHLSKELPDLLKKMTEKDPKERYTVEECLEHRFFL
jgi:calcium/calmodulin-dependent protein kinase I